MADNVLIKPATGVGTASVRAHEYDGQLYPAMIPADTAGNLNPTLIVKQDVVASNNNNLTDHTIPGGGTHECSGESTLNVAGIQVNFYADTNCIVKVQQSMDNIVWFLEDEFDYVHDTGFGITVQATASYFRIVIDNSESTTSTVNLQTALCPIIEALPRALDENGNLKVSIGDIDCDYGFEIHGTPSGTLQSAQAIRLAGVEFGASVDTNFWSVGNAGTVSAAGVSNAMAVISSGTSNSGYGYITTNRIARYVPRQPHVFHAAIMVTGAAANCTRRWGAFTLDGSRNVLNGFYFEIDGSGVFSINAQAGGSSLTTMASGSFNGKVKEYVVSTDMPHVYEIFYNNTSATYIIDGVVIHRLVMESAGRLTASMHLNATAITSNSAGGTASGTLNIYSMSISRLGNLVNAPAVKYTAVSAACKVGPGVAHSLVLSGIANGAIVTLYDNTAASGTVLWASGTMTISTNSALPSIVNINFSHGVPFINGLYVAVTGAACNVLITYE